MSEAVDRVKTQYDEVPYTSHPFPQTAPGHLAAIAWLFGLEAPPPATARVLELGCAAGGNLIAFAAGNPRASALGLDLSGVQIAQGRERVAALGLGNVELRQADLGKLPPGELGQYDYIVCHGVYSWVPAHVQEAILALCKAHLAPDGIAYVSYNTYPGWKAKEIVRDAMMLRGNPRNAPGERLSFARGMVDFLQQVARRDSVLAKALEESAPLLRDSQDYYLLHEYLEAFNAPCYFQQFLDRAGTHALAYLAEAEASSMFVSNYGAEVSEPLLRECGHSQVLLEQYLDFVVNRTFRQTLLVHESRAGAIRYRLERTRLAGLHYAAQLPCRDGATRLDDSRQDYGLDAQGSLHTNRPVVKRAIDALTAAWPQTIAYDALQAQATEGLPGDAAALRQDIDALLEHLVTHGLGRYRREPVRVEAIGERPELPAAVRGLALAARADADPGTFNAWHETVLLDPVERWLLPELDGGLDRTALVASLRSHIAQGHVVLLRDGVPVTDADALAERAADEVDAMLARLVRAKLLRAG